MKNRDISRMTWAELDDYGRELSDWIEVAAECERTYEEQQLIIEKDRVNREKRFREKQAVKGG